MVSDIPERVRALEDKFTVIMVNLTTIRSDLDSIKAKLNGQAQFRKGAGKFIAGSVSTVVTALVGAYFMARMGLHK